MYNSMTATHSIWERLNQPKVETLDRNVPRTGCLDSFEIRDRKFRLIPTYLDHKQLVAEGNSIYGNQSVITVSPSSVYFNRSSAFQTFFIPPCPYNSSLLGTNADRDSLSVLPNQMRRNQFINPPASQGAFELKPLSYRAQASTGRQSVVEVEKGKGKPKTASRRLSSTSCHCSFSEVQDADIKQDSKPRGKRKPKVKDEKYWRKRAKNNLAAKKSRDAKRRQELYTQNMATSLETENARLRLELNSLQQEIRKLKRWLTIYIME